MPAGMDGRGRLDERLEQFIRQMPKVELHLHLEGSIQPTTLLELARRHGVALPAADVEGLSRWFRFQHAKAQGLRAWPHAGETQGPASVWGAIHALGADRIAHGVRAIEDPALLAYLAAHHIACDVCPTSNVCLGVYPSVAQHPIRRLLEAGVPVTLNSDDPPLFNTTLTDEFLALARDQAFSAAELATLVRTAVEVSFLPEAQKLALRARIEAELADVARETGIAL